jgi:hypothetical protein
MARVLEKYRHPLLLCLRMFRKVAVPFIFVRASWQLWLIAASLMTPKVRLTRPL